MRKDKHISLYGAAGFRGDKERSSSELKTFYNMWWLDIWKEEASLSYNELDELWEKLEWLDNTMEHIALTSLQVLYNLILMAFWKHDNKAVEDYRKKFDAIWWEFEYGVDQVGNEYFALNNLLDKKMEKMRRDPEYQKSTKTLVKNEEEIMRVLRSEEE